MAITETPTPSILKGFLSGLGDLQARLASVPQVYPAYIACRLGQALRKLVADGDPKLDAPIIASVGDIENIGDCRYALPVIDHNGTRYRITVEVL